MIPFASQRGKGQDLAAHLLNAHDNEYVEVAELSGAVAADLHGAFAEWEAQAHALTKCKKYLYSMSVNPDPEQGRLTREQYKDYIDRAEARLGLSGQPRAVVFHIKDGREHCHVVWSRIDAFQEKAVHMPFDKDKLMMVTKEFARDHDLQLPEGYFKDRGREKPEQVSVYDMAQQRASGLTKADHIEAVTDAWCASDTAKAFVQALAEKGYMLATGNKPYVLVDFYGGMHALPKMISDKSVRTKQIREFLGQDYLPESLPTVDEAKALIAEYRKSVEKHLKFEQLAAVHFHMLFLDGVYVERADGTLRFRWVKAPSTAELVRLTQTLALRIGRYLERQGLLERDAEQSYLTGDGLEPGPMDQLRGSSITYRIAVGPQQGRKVFTLQTLPACDEPFDAEVGKVAGFSLHAGVAARADERQKLERLCRYISRPAIAEQRLSLTSNGNVRYQLKTPYRDGTTHAVFEPLDFIARLAALVPKPRVNLTRYNGVFAPNSKHRARVTPAKRGRGGQHDVTAATITLPHKSIG